MTTSSPDSAREGYWLLGREVRASNADPSPIGELWGGLFSAPFRDTVAGRASDDVHSVYCDYEGDHTQPYTVFLGYRVTDEPTAATELTRRFVPSGNYVEHIADGPPPASVVAAWEAIWASDLDRVFEADYEIHPAEQGAPIRIYVGVR